MATKPKPQKKPGEPGVNMRPYAVLQVDEAAQIIREVGIASGAKGTDAIKVATRNSDGKTYTAGDYRAVPLGTWESESNNLTILSEEKVVTSFITRGRAKAETNERVEAE